MNQKLIFSNDFNAALDEILADCAYNRLFVIADVNIDRFVMPRIADNPHIASAVKIVTKCGDVNKNIDTLAEVWSGLQQGGATRYSMVLNIGGGVITDMGGFAASTFKRGMRFVNIPTTLLAAVDAAVGGKTGVNFNGYKNEIGVFNEADAVLISSRFFDTLSLTELKSGYGEMVKHALLSDRNSLNEILNFHFEDVAGDTLLSLVAKSVQVKKRIVEEDPTEKGIRKALNLGHTVGHAFESLAMKRLAPVPHGYAVAWGIITELVLSHFALGFDSSLLDRLGKYIVEHYGAFSFGCDDYDNLISLMRHDKKSSAGELNFTLLHDVGKVEINCNVEEKDLRDALDITRDIMHI